MNDALQKQSPLPIGKALLSVPKPVMKSDKTKVGSQTTGCKRGLNERVL